MSVICDHKLALEFRSEFESGGVEKVKVVVGEQSGEKRVREEVQSGVVVEEVLREAVFELGGEVVSELGVEDIALVFVRNVLSDALAVVRRERNEVHTVAFLVENALSTALTEVEEEDAVLLLLDNAFADELTEVAAEVSMEWESDSDSEESVESAVSEEQSRIPENITFSFRVREALMRKKNEAMFQPPREAELKLIEAKRKFEFVHEQYLRSPEYIRKRKREEKRLEMEIFLERRRQKEARRSWWKKMFFAFCW